MSIKIYVKYVKNNRDFHTTKLNLPTGNLDQKNSREIIKLFRELNEKYGQTILLITHDEKIAEHAERILVIEDGQIVKDSRR